MKATRRRLDRAAVVAAAELLVDRNGAAQLTVTALANELEIRGPSLYSHVANLEELLSLVQNRALAELGTGLQRAAMGRSGRDGVRALAAALRTFATAHPGRYDLAMSKPIDRPAMQVASRAAGEASWSSSNPWACRCPTSLRSRVWRPCTESSLGSCGPLPPIRGRCRRRLRPGNRTRPAHYGTGRTHRLTR